MTHIRRNSDALPGEAISSTRSSAFGFAPPNRQAEVSLGTQQQITPSDVNAWLSVNDLELPVSAVRDMALRLTDLPAVNAVTRMDTFQAVYADHNGHSFEDGVNMETALGLLRTSGRPELAASVRAVIDAGRNHERPTGVKPYYDGTPSHPAPVTSDEVQSGEVFDTVVCPDGTEFFRSRASNWPNEPQAIRIQANRPLTAGEVEKMGGLVGYALMASLGGEPAGDPEQDSPYSFIMGKDTTKGRGSLDKFEDDLAETIINGSPRRKTNRSGPGTAGTSLVDGIGDDTLIFEIYYDDVC